MTYRNPGHRGHAFPAQRATLTSEDMREGPAALYAKLRAQYGSVVPIYLEQEDGDDLEAWLVIGYAELQKVGQDETLFSRDSRNWGALARHQVSASWPLLPQISWRDNTRFADEPYHQPRRDALNKALQAIDLKATRAIVEEYADALIDRFSALGTAELVKEFAGPLPVLILARLFGVRGPAEESRLLDKIYRMLAGGDEAQRADHEIAGILRQLVKDRRLTPDEDVTSWLIAAAPGLDDEAVREELWLMLVSGAGAAAGLIANTLAQLATDVNLRRGLNGRWLTVNAVIRAACWNTPPAENVMGAFATQDCRLGGWNIAQGDMLILGLGGGNHDPVLGHSDDRDAYTVSNDSHLAYGVGSHRCPSPARQLGEMIAAVAVERLYDRCPEMRLDRRPELSWGPSFVVRALTDLHVKFRPTPRGARRELRESIFGGPSCPSPHGTPPSLPWDSTPLSTDSTPSPKTSPARGRSSKPSGRSSRWSSLTKWWRGQ